MRDISQIKAIIDSRRYFEKRYSRVSYTKREEEGGCGVTGFACSIPVRGKHIFEPSKQILVLVVN